MWQSLGRNLKGLLTAVCLLAFLLSSLEIWLRVDRYHSALTCQPALATAGLRLEDQLLAPSTTTWVELLPSAKITLKSPDSGDLIEFKTNSFGARGPEPLVPKPEGVLRVLCLGDETLLASELSEADGYPARLEEFLKTSLGTRVEVINAGLPGNCPRIAALQLRHRLWALQPDLVVLHFDMSDVAEDAAVRRFVSLDRQGSPVLATHPATRKACQLTRPCLCEEFMVVQQAQIQLAKLWDRQMPASDEAVTSPHQRYRWTEDSPTDLDAEIESALAPLTSIRDQCAAMGAKLLVSTTPKPWQVSAKASHSPEARTANGIPKDACWTSTAPFKRLVAACKTAGIPYVIPLSAFLETPQPERLFLRKTPGLSALGHELYARSLANSISGESSVAPSSEPDIVPSKAEEPAWTQPPAN